jgi:hypothetical protein
MNLQRESPYGYLVRKDSQPMQDARPSGSVPVPRLLLFVLPGLLMQVAIACTPTLLGIQLSPAAALAAPLLMLAAFALLWWLSRSGTLAASTTYIFHRRSLLWLVLLIPLVLWGGATWMLNINALWHARGYIMDALAYLHLDAVLVLHGLNPYSHAATFWEAAQRWPTVYPTPLLRGIYATSALHYPTPPSLLAQIHAELLNPSLRRGEFDPATAHNYPAGAIWLALLAVWAGSLSIQWLNIAALGVMALLVLWHAPARYRSTIGMIVLCQTIIFYTTFDALCLVFVLAGWHWLPQQRLSPALLGWGCAVKQLAWFFVPLYLIQIARAEGWHAAARRAVWLGGAFLLPNLPFILADPGAWVHSQFVPMADPMFPGGVGIVAPALGGVWPLWPAWNYAALEAGAWLGVCVVQWRRPAITSDGLILALLPLFFARRDFATYTALLPLLALWVAADHLRPVSNHPSAAAMSTIAAERTSAPPAPASAPG